MITRTLLLLSTLVLFTGCQELGAGTRLAFDGTVCGQPVALTYSSEVDRAGAAIDVACPDSGSVRITTNDSSASSVNAAGADLIGRSIAAALKVAGTP